MKQAPLRIGLIGCGQMAQHHAKTLNRLGVKLQAVCGRPGSTRAKKFARLFKIPHVVSSWEEVANDPRVDALWVTTPPEITGKLLLPLVRVSKPMFLEKPVALDSETIAKALKIQEEKGTPVAVGMNRRCYDFIPELQQILKRQVPQVIVLHLPEQVADDLSGGLLKQPWLVRSIHEIDLLFHLMGPLRIQTIRRSSQNSGSGFHGLLESEKTRTPIHLIGAWGAPWNKAIRFFFDNLVVELCPIERMRIYHKMDAIPATRRTPIARFEPRVKKEQWASTRCKPGLEIQDRAVVEGWRSGRTPKNVATLADAYQTTCLIESILDDSTQNKKSSLKKVVRIPHSPETRENLELMDRNERTADFPPKVMGEIQELITPFLLRAYPEPEAFYKKLAHWLDVPREKILLSMGADEGMRAVFEAFVETGDEVVHVIPSYAMVPVYCQIAGAVSKPVTFQADLSLPLERILAAITPRTKMVLLANPNQPVERRYDEAECRQILERCKRFGVILLMDEVYYPFGNVTAMPLVEEYPNLVVARSFSKAFGVAGLRLGYLVSDKTNIREIDKVRPMYEAHSLALAIGGYLLDNDHLMKSYVAQVQESRRFLRNAFEGLRFRVHGQWGNSLLVELPSKLAAGQIQEKLREKGFLVRAETTAPLSNHLRITLGPPEQAKRFFACFEELAVSRQPHGVAR